MNDLLQTRIFRLLSETSQEVTNQEMQNAYGEFVEQIRIVGDGDDYSTTYRIFVATRIEIASLETAPLYGQGKNALKQRFLQKTLAIINAELELLNFKIIHPESFPSATTLTFESPLSVIPKFQYLGIMGMTEILSALMLLGGVIDNTGKNPTIIAFSEVFEQAFGFSFNGIYDRQSELFKRKSCNLTKTLDALKAVLIKEYKKRQAEALKNKDEKR